MSKHIGGVGPILIFMILLVVCIPLFAGVCISHLINANGTNQYNIIIGISILIWSLLGIFYYN